MSETLTVLDELMMAQQPIFNSKKELFGYELLFRSGTNENTAEVEDGRQATSQVIVNLCIGITELEAQLRQPFFINMTTDLVLSDAFFPISPDTVFIEILENQEITRDFVNAVERWHSAGYRFVLDDYQFCQQYDALLPFMSMVKVDVLDTHPEHFAKQLGILKQRGIQLVAEKVENNEMFKLCVDLGFEYFQGYYLKRPEIIKGKRVDSNIESAMNLVNALQSDDITINTIAEMVSHHPKLSYQLLRVLNSPVAGIPRKVESIKEAVVYLGLEQLRKWAMLITVTSSGTKNLDQLKLVLVRARCCQLLADKSKSISSEVAFTMGLMSGVDTLLGLDKRLALRQIALREDITKAILSGEGPLGKLLYCTICIEKERWENIEKMPPQIRKALNHAFFDALKWANEITQQLK